MVKPLGRTLEAGGVYVSMLSSASLRLDVDTLGRRGGLGAGRQGQCVKGLLTCPLIEPGGRIVEPLTSDVEGGLSIEPTVFDLVEEELSQELLHDPCLAVGPLDTSGVGRKQGAS